jgi:hypothetical protein
MKVDVITLSDVAKSSSQFPGIDSILSEPKIPLKNYLLDLVAESDGKESSVYLKRVEKFIQEIWNEMIRNNQRTLRIRKFIPEKLEFLQSIRIKMERKRFQSRSCINYFFYGKSTAKKMRRS